MSLSLVLSVPDLQAARILAAAGVPQIALLQSNPHFAEIKSWLEGVSVGAQITDPNVSLPQADFFIIPFIFFDQFSFMNTRMYWLGDQGEITDKQGNLIFLPFAVENEVVSSWLDWEQNYEKVEELFL
jgi:hypothetical protein